MATDPDFVQHVQDQAGLGERLVCRKMFGEYGFHLDGKFVAMACENQFFVKETEAVEKLGLDLPKAPPYPGAKPYPIADALLDDGPLLASLLLETAARVPEKRTKRKR